MAISLDGKISTHAYTSATFTSELDTNRLFELRARADALLVGRGTLEADSMTMTVPKTVLKGKDPPVRCVISRKGSFDGDHPLFHSTGSKILLFANECSKTSVMGQPLIQIDSLNDLLENLYERGIRHLHCEGGGELLNTLFSMDLIDTVFLTWKIDTLFGGDKAPSISGSIMNYFDSSKCFRLEKFEKSLSNELFIEYQRVR